MRFAEKLQAGQTYTSWVKMQPMTGQGKMVIGDVHVFKNGSPIGVVGKFLIFTGQTLHTNT